MENQIGPRVRAKIDTTSRDVESYSVTAEVFVGHVPSPEEWEEAREVAILQARLVIAELRAGRQGPAP